MVFFFPVFFLPEKSAFHEWRFYAHKFHRTGQQKDLYISRGGCVATHRRAMIPYFPSTVPIVSFFSLSSFFSVFFLPTANYSSRFTMLHHFPQLPFFPFLFSLPSCSSLQARSRSIAKIDISIVSRSEKSEFAWRISARDANMPRTYPASLARPIHVNGSIACRTYKKRKQKSSSLPWTKLEDRRKRRHGQSNFLFHR